MPSLPRDVVVTAAASGPHPAPPPLLGSASLPLQCFLRSIMWSVAVVLWAGLGAAVDAK